VEGGSIALPGGLVAELLPKPVQALAERLERAGVEGIDIDAPPAPGAKRDFALLCRVGRAISLDGRLFLSTAAFQELAGAITQGRAIGSRFSVGDAKASTGLSRKWILPLLNRMEGAGMVKREGDDRIVLQGEK
ncbi:MAG: SelB C-terminal domain-containing protein, partial [Spirochaetota bacterium]